MCLDLGHGIGDGVCLRVQHFHTGNTQMMREKRYVDFTKLHFVHLFERTNDEKRLSQDGISATIRRYEVSFHFDINFS
jgi:CHASE1-domain containing sensor protein